MCLIHVSAWAWGRGADMDPTQVKRLSWRTRLCPGFARKLSRALDLVIKHKFKAIIEDTKRKRTCRSSIQHPLPHSLMYTACALVIYPVCRCRDVDSFYFGLIPMLSAYVKAEQLALSVCCNSALAVVAYDRAWWLLISTCTAVGGSDKQHSSILVLHTWHCVSGEREKRGG